MTNITTTQLKQQTRKVIKQISQSNEPIIISTYGEPKAIMISYEVWKKQNIGNKADALKKIMLKSKKEINSTEIFRKWRDEE